MADRAEAGVFLEPTEDGHFLSLRDVLQFLRSRLWIILLMPILCGGASLVLSLVQTPTYEASIKMLVGQERGATENPADVGSLQQITKTMSEGINSRPVAETVIQRLDLQMAPEDLLGQHLSVKQIPDTQFIQVSYRDSSPDRAQQVANTIGEVFSEQISQASPSASAITATVWEGAVTPVEPVSPQPRRNVLLGLALGLALGIGLALLLEYLDDSWRSPEEAEQISGVPTFGVIPELGALTDKKKGE